VALVIFGLNRMRVRPTATEKTPYVYAPRTTFTIGRLLGSSRERGNSVRSKTDEH